jgi:deoxycytidylate deaminase
LRLASPINVHTQRGRGRERDLVGAIIVNGASVLSIRDAGSPAQHNHMDARALRDRKMAARKRGDQRPLTMANVDEHTVGSKSIEWCDRCAASCLTSSVSAENTFCRAACDRSAHAPCTHPQVPQLANATAVYASIRSVHGRLYIILDTCSFLRD